MVEGGGGSGIVDDPWDMRARYIRKQYSLKYAV